jgi:hypothetical protein
MTDKVSFSESKIVRKTDESLGRYVPRPNKERSVAMDRDGGPTLIFQSTAALAMRADHKFKEQMDLWKVTLQRVGASGEPLSNKVSFDYHTGIGHRVTLIAPGQAETATVEPSCSSLIQAVAADAGIALDMPRSDEDGVAYMQNVLGYDNARSALVTFRAIGAMADKCSTLLAGSGATLEEFVGFGAELEALPVARKQRSGDFTIELPRLEQDGILYRGSLHIAIKKASRIGMDIDGHPVPDGALELSITGDVLEKLPKGRWRSNCSGQTVDTVATLWAGYAAVQELCTLWSRWHLNTMKPGSRAQSEALEAAIGGKSRDFAENEATLYGLGLLLDKSNPGFGEKGYRYGSQWLTEVLPEDVVSRINELRSIIETSEPEPLLRTRSNLIM